MPLNISNLQSPQSAALNNKINPSPLGVANSTPSFSGSNPQQLSASSFGGQSSAYSSSGAANFQPSTAVKSITSPNGTTTTFHPPTNTYQPLLDYQKANGGDTSMAGLTQLASSKGISGYTGTDAQNTQLASLLKSGPQSSQTTAFPSSSGYINPDGTPISNATQQTNGATQLQGLTGNSPVPQYVPNDQGLYGKLVTGLANTPQNTQAVNEAIANIANLQNNYQQQRNQIMTNSGNLTQAGGREGLLAQQYQTANVAAQTQLQNALEEQKLKQSALNQAAGLAQPQLATYSQQAFNPLTGQFSAGGSLNDAVNSVVQKLQSGTMTYDQATSALSGYGQGGINALQAALPKGFNISQSSTLASQQGSIKPALDYAQLAMQNLKNAFSGLTVPGQSSNIQPVADVSNWFSNLSGIGKEAVRTKEGALAEARSAIQKVLASVQGGTPTDYVGQSNALLPTNATPADVDAALANLQTLGTGKATIYGNPGVSGTQTTAPGSSLYSW